MFDMFTMFLVKKNINLWRVVCVLLQLFTHFYSFPQALMKLPTPISQSEEVLNFFETKSEDLNPPTEWVTGSASNCVALAHFSVTKL